MSGVFVMVVGPSGAGKDTLIAAAQRALAADPRFVFARRLVTRRALADAEDHDSIDRQSFERERQRGGYALAWEAHGLGYALPDSVTREVAAGRIVIANVSRRVVPEALDAYPRAVVMVVSARPEIRAQRLIGRGRESADDVASRLAREAPPVPEGVAAVVIDNSGALDAGIAAFTAALREVAATR